MKRMFMTLLIGLWTLAGCVNTAVKEAGNVIERTFGLVPSNVKLVLMDRPDSLDTYALSVSDDVLTVEGTSSVALCKGFYDYILSNGYGIAGWSGNRLDFPSELADLQRSVCTSPFSDRLYYNVCTFGYTTPFWGWEQWEKEIDWIALHGFTMPLAPVAGEAILARVWSGLIRDFYVPRLNFYFDKAIRGEYADMVAYDTLFLNVTEPGELSAVQPFADPLKEACRLVDSYSDIVSGNDCSAGEGVLYWCPQDFVRQGENRIRITVPASEFVRKNGLKFSKLRGDEVKIRKIDFRSGPDTVLVLEPDVLLDRSSEDASIPYGIVDQTRRFEREIYIYITFEGGPQSWGLISLY